MEYVKRQGAELSFIDRLVIQDQTPQNQYRTGIRRDLEDLLNTVVRARSIPNRLDDLNDSLINYGIVDLLTVNLTTQSDRDKIIEYIKHQIEKFEPRLFNIAIIDVVFTIIGSYFLHQKLNKSHPKLKLFHVLIFLPMFFSIIIII
jgi:type VI secretion system lysozyme-like protein